ncbi:MAG: SAM-dependent methyltransferase [Anaerovoracaceae bacterium]
MDDTIRLLNKLLEEEALISAVLSDRRKKSDPCSKVALRPIQMKEELLYQAEYHHRDKVFHENRKPEEVPSLVEQLLRDRFKQAGLFSVDGDYTILANKPDREKILSAPPSKKFADLSHNREKQYLLPEGEPCDFLILLGIMTPEGKIATRHRNKFRQINRFLEIVEDCLPMLPEHPLIIDFGCGKSYLTFAMYYYLNNRLNLGARFVGLDLKEDVIAFCNRTAQTLGYEDLSFQVGDIAQYSRDARADMVVTLHACDTATDYALIQAVHWQAQVILSVPCCQHELFSQLNNPDQHAVLKHGILKDRFAAILTDAFRALALELNGYEVSMIEFTSLEHTAKNILLRCIRKKIGADAAEKAVEFAELCTYWNVHPTIASLLKK